MEWNKEWFPRMKNISVALFRSKQETRKYLDNASQILGIKEWKDWGNISTRKFASIGGQSIISEHGSIFQALQFAYPGTTCFYTYLYEQKWNGK